MALKSNNLIDRYSFLNLNFEKTKYDGYLSIEMQIKLPPYGEGKVREVHHPARDIFEDEIGPKKNIMQKSMYKDD